MALLLPFLLALTGGAIDLARAYHAQMTLQSATRNAAEYVATNSKDEAGADAAGLRVVCLEMRQAPGFEAGVPPDGEEQCVSPDVDVTFALSEEPSEGASEENPIGTATVSTSVDFGTLVPWPMLPNSWTLTSESTFSIIQDRPL